MSNLFKILQKVGFFEKNQLKLKFELVKDPAIKRRIFLKINLINTN